MIVIDANAALTHHVVFDGRDKDGRPVRVERRNRGPVADMVDAAMESEDIVIPYKAAAEARRAAPKAVRSAAKDAGVVDYDEYNVTRDIREKIADMYRRAGVRDSPAYLKKAGAVYAEAWTDEQMQGAIDIRRIVKELRGKDASMPTPEKNRGDFKILSTAAHLVEQGFEVTLPAFDQDFVAFAAAIREKLGVDVVDCGRLGRQ